MKKTLKQRYATFIDNDPIISEALSIIAGEPLQEEQGPAQTSNVAKADPHWSCKKCGMLQPNSEKKCAKCGVHKNSSEETEKAEVENEGVRSMQIVENNRRGMLESMDDDGSIMGIPLHLDEGCKFSFDKHMDAIVAQQEQADEDMREKQTRARPDKEFDRRYKEMPRDRIKFGKR